MKKQNKKRSTTLFVIILILAVAVLGLSVVKTNAFNNAEHSDVFAGADLFAPDDTVKEKDVTIVAAARGDTWNKIFDIENVGSTDYNYKAYIYDFTVSNNTRDQVKDFTFKLTFGTDAYLASAWNGALEIHQNVKGGELVEVVPDLREFVATDYSLETFTADGETFIHMKPGDYLVYRPSSSMNAMEIPIEPYEGTTPGIIMYIEIGDSLENGSSIELDYTFHRHLQAEPLFWASLIGMGIWAVALVTYAITSAQIKKYQERHERDNEIINESIETFTGFIDAKDPYTNGHSKRVAKYTRMIAEEMGYEGEELDRIYYIALLHDCGKIAVPDNILGKPGKLTEEEFEIIKSHTVRGGEILSSFHSLENAGEGALYHHERYDGKGYPEGRAGEDIPLIGRMICVADSFDAMNTSRVYRHRLTKDKIISELTDNKGKQFDPAIADIMLGLIRDGKIVIE